MANQVSLQQLKEMLVDKLNLKSVAADQITDEHALFGPDGLGLDSVDALELVLAIESEYGIQIQDEEVGREAFSSVSVLCAFINQRLADAGEEDAGGESASGEGSAAAAT